MKSLLATRLVVVLGALLLAGGWGWWAFQARAKAISTVPPRPDLSGWVPGFAAALDAAEATAGSRRHQAAGLARLGQLYQANGFYDQAAACYRTLVDLEPRDAKWPHRLAGVLAGFGRLEEALPFQQQAVDLAPDNLVCRVRLGDIELKNNRPDLATATYTAALKLDSASSYALLGLARCDLVGGKWIAAKTHLLSIVEHQPRFPGVWDLLATVHDHLGETDAAAGSRRAAALIGRFREMPDPWLANDPGDCYDPYQLSVAADLSSNRTEARQRLERAIELAPAESAYHRQLAKLLVKAGDIPGARTHLEAAVNAVPSDAESWSALVDALIGANDMAAANSALGRGLANCPQSSYLHFLDGLRLAGLGRLDEALEVFTTSKRLQPNQARAYVQLSAIYVRQSRLPEALAEIRAALATEPGNAGIMVLAAGLTIASNDETGARNLIEKLQHSPQTPAEDLAGIEQLFRNQFGHAAH